MTTPMPPTLFEAFQATLKNNASPSPQINPLATPPAAPGSAANEPTPAGDPPNARPIYNAIVEAALAYIERGWPVLELHGIVNGVCTCGKPDGWVDPATRRKHKSGKHPRTAHGVDDATLDPEVAKRFRTDSNIGLAQGKGRVAVDIDKGSGGLESWERLVAEHGEPAHTVVVLTPGGGFHFYFALPEGVHTSNTQGKIATGIDSRGDAGYVCAPPSRHISGGQYLFAEGCAP